MTDGEELLQCEECGNEHPESEMHIEEYPGATLAFCPSCSEPPRHKQYGAHP